MYSPLAPSTRVSAARSPIHETLRDVATSSAGLSGEPAGIVDAEHVQCAAEREPAPHTHGEVEDLGVGEARGAETREESVVDRVMIKDEPLGVLDRASLPVGVPGVRLPSAPVR